MAATRRATIIWRARKTPTRCRNIATSRSAITAGTASTVVTGGRCRKRTLSGEACLFTGHSTDTGVLFVRLDRPWSQRHHGSIHGPDFLLATLLSFGLTRFAWRCVTACAALPDSAVFGWFSH